MASPPKDVEMGTKDVKFVFEFIGDSFNDYDGSSASKNACYFADDEIRDCYGNLVAIFADKTVLAASSPVFNTMFYGPFNETGDVKITDTSPTAFREFLQIFYSNQVKLSIENLGEVMKLIDKYDVKDGWCIVETFFHERLTIGDILWGLHLAIEFRQDDLIIHCMNTIKRNIATVCDMIEIDGSGKPKLRSNSNNRPMTDADLENIYSRVYAMIMKYVLGSVPVKMTDAILLEMKFGGSCTIDQIQDISFSSNCSLLLTHITYPMVYVYNTYHYVDQRQYDVKICIAGKETIHSIPWKGGIIEFSTPILIHPNRMYTIQTKIANHPFSSPPFFNAYKIPSGPVKVAQNIQITFDKVHSSSIVAAINFSQYD